MIDAGSLGYRPCDGKSTPPKPSDSVFRTLAGPNVAVCTSRVSFDIVNVTVVFGLICSVCGNIVKSSTPSLADSPRLTVFEAGFDFASFLATLTALVIWLTSALWFCFAEGIFLPLGLTITLPTMPGCTSQKYL